MLLNGVIGLAAAAGAAGGGAVRRLRLVPEPGALVPVEPDGQRGAPQPAGLVPLRRHPDVQDAGAGQQLIRARRRRRRRPEAVRRERRLVCRARHAAQAR